MKYSLSKCYALVLFYGCLAFCLVILFWNYWSPSHINADSPRNSLDLLQPRLHLNFRKKTLPNAIRQSAWDKGSFCDEFLHRTFQQPVPVCAKNGVRSSVSCFGAKHSNKMVLCSMENVLVRPKQLYEAMTTQKIIRSNAITILNAHNKPNPTMCVSPNTSSLKSATEMRDHVKLMVEDAVMKKPSHNSTEDCQTWVNDPTFLFRGIDAHVYFEFLSWFNLYKTIMDEGHPVPLQIIRMPVGTYGCRFGEFEQQLFPNVTVLDDMSDNPVCYKRLVLVPSCYASLLFKCKSEPDLRQLCYRCNGSRRPQSDFQMFRSHVLKTCSIDDTYPTSTYKLPNNIVIILRKPYKRIPDDDPKRFERVLSNGNEMVSAIRKKFSANVTVIYPEDLDMCQQIQMAHDADILIGVHGAGLVHSWWLRDSALLLELVPREMLANPTFKMLTMLAGRQYIEYIIDHDHRTTVIVNVTEVVSILTNLQRK